MRRAWLFAGCLAFVTACGGGGETSAQAEDAAGETGAAPAAAVPEEGGLMPDETEFDAALGVDLDAMTQTESGLYVQVLEEGEGPEAASGDAMGVDYTVWLADGSKLDASADHQPPTPLSMVLGRTRLIDGWTEGVTGMRLGEKRRLVVPWNLAYGAGGSPPAVPPYSNLVFEVQLAEHTPATAE